MMHVKRHVSTMRNVALGIVQGRTWTADTGLIGRARATHMVMDAMTGFN